jgi:hypothetical protein
MGRSAGKGIGVRVCCPGERQANSSWLTSDRLRYAANNEQRVATVARAEEEAGFAPVAIVVEIHLAAKDFE